MKNLLLFGMMLVHCASYSADTGDDFGKPQIRMRHVTDSTWVLFDDIAHTAVLLKITPVTPIVTLTTNGTQQMNGDQFTQLMLGGCDTVLVENYKKIHLVSVFPVTRYKINSYDRYVRIVGTNVSDFSLETEKPVTQTLHTWIFAIIYALLAYIIAYSNRFVLWILIFLPTFFGALGLTYQALEKHWPGTVFILLLCYLAVLIIVMLAGFRAGQKKRKKTLFRA